MSEPRTVLIVLGATIVGSGAGLIAAGPGGAVAAGMAGLATGVAIGVFRVRPFVAISVAVATVVGIVVGRSIVHVLCAPSECVALEWITGLATGAGAFVGVGLVVALATRSFEEYNEAVAANRPPPTPGCEADEAGEEG